MPVSWKNRATYGKLLKKVIARQVKRYENCTDDDIATKIAANIGYLTDKINNIIKHLEELDSKSSSCIQISEEQVKEITRKLIFVGGNQYTETEFLATVIARTKCDKATAQSILYKMFDLGLGLASDNFPHKISLLGFAIMRDYITEEESFQLLNKFPIPETSTDVSNDKSLKRCN